MPRRLLDLLLRLYPAAIRREYREDLIAALERAWHDRRAARPRLGSYLAVGRAMADAARARLGSRRETRWMRARGAEPVPPRLLQDCGADVRFAWRTIRRSPGFFGGLLLALSLGIGANAAVFSLVKAVVLRPLPYDRPDDLVMLWRSPVVPREFWRSATTPRFVLAWRDKAADVAEIAAMAGVGSLEAQMDLAGADGAERLRGAFATPNFFDVLGARPALGRLFTTADDGPARADIVVIAHSLWTRAFGSDPHVIGRTVPLATGRGLRRVTRPFTIVGVLGPAFRFTYPEAVEVWTPRAWAEIAREPADSIGYTVVGRLTPGVTIEAAGARFAALHEHIAPTAPDRPVESRMTTRLEPIHEWIVGDSRRIMSLLTGVAALLLLVTCSTAASALFIQVTERAREIAMRSALGAGRARLLRQWLIEGAALAAGATAGGLLLAAGLMPAIRQLVPPSVPRADEIALDQALVWFAATVVAVVTALAALAPAWRASRVDVIAGLKRSATAVSADRSTTLWRRLLVGLQAGLAAALLAVAGLLLASFWRLTHVPLGFSADGVLAVELRVLDRQRYRHDDQLRRLQADLIDRVSAVPGVSAVAIASAVPFRGVDWTYNVDRLDGAGGSVSANARQVDAAYFAVMGISLRRGRLLQASDIAGAPSVAVVSEAFARDLFGDEDPIGREIGVIEPHRSRIVGVVGDVRYASLDSEPRRAVYLSRAQHPSELMCLLVRGFGVVPVSAVRRAVQEADPALPAMHAATIDEIASRTLSTRRFYTMTTALFAGLAVVLTLGGLVVIVARAVVERRKELAICAALGATGRRLQGKVVRGASLPVAVGLAFGLAAAYVSAPVLGTLLFEIDPRSAAVFAITAASIAGASATAAWIASRRATATAPSILLRE